MSILPKFTSGKSILYLDDNKILRVIIIRPGETAFDRQRHIQGNLNLHLTEHGQKEAAQIAEQLNNEQLLHIYSSPNCSAIETADRIANQLKIPSKVLESLRNQDHGLWEGRRVADIRLTQPRLYRSAVNSPQNVAPPKGEAFDEAQKRLKKAIKWILKRHRSGTIGIVICEPAASIVRCCLKSEEARNLWDFIGKHGLWEPVEIHPPAIFKKA